MALPAPLALLLCACVAESSPGRALEDPLAKVPPLPVVQVTRGREAANWGNLGREAEAAFGFDIVRGAGARFIRSLSPEAAEMQAAEDEAHPWGTFSLHNGLHPGNILSARALLLGVGVSKSVWTPRPDGTKGWPVHTSKQVWRWDAPTEMRLAWPQWSWPVYRERYAALCGVMDSWAIEPTLWLFDAATPGPKWEATVPFRATYAAYCTRTGQPFRTRTWAANPTVYPAVAHDGSRVLVWAGDGGPRVSFLFAYDGAGNPLSVVEAPGYWAWPRNDGVMRAPTAPLFALRAQRRDDAAPGGTVDDYFLVNGEGDFLGRFVDETGQPLAPDKLSNTHAYAKRPERDGTYTEFIIRLAIGR